MPEATETLPQSELKHINSIAEKFRNLTQGIEATPEKPAAIAPVEPPKPAAPAEAAKPEIAAPPELKGRARLQFQKLEDQMRKYRTDFESTKAERDALKAELEAAKKNGHAPELDTLRKELSERDKVLAAVAIEKMPAFQAHFSERFQTVIDEAKEAVGADHAPKVEKVFAMPPSEARDQQFNALAGEFSDITKLSLLDLYRSHRRTEKDREAELGKAPETLRHLQEQAARAQKEAELKQVRERAALLGHIVSEIEPELAGADPELSKAIVGDTRRFVEGGASLSPELYVKTLTDAAKWRRHEKAFREQGDELAKLRSQLAEFQSVNPSLRSSTTATQRKAPPPLDNSDIGPRFRQLSGVR
jgi:hypothetical protein